MHFPFHNPPFPATILGFMPSASAPGSHHEQPADAPRESALPEGDAVIQQIAALTRDLADLRYEHFCAEEAKDKGEVASIEDAITRTQKEIAALTQDPATKEHFEQFRQEQFSIVSRVHTLHRKAHRIEKLHAQEHALSRQYSSRRPSSHAREKILSTQREQQRLQQEMDKALCDDPALALAWRSRQLREYRRQLQKDRFAETPSRTLLMDRLSTLLADERKVLLTGPTGTGKTELAKHTLRPFSGEPEILSGHQGLTSYDVYGKPILTTSSEGATISSFHLGAFPRAAQEGRGLIIDEIDLIPTQTLLRHKADWNLRTGDTLRIQEDASNTIPIKKGFGVVATANIKGAKHKEREPLDPAVTRLFEPLPVPYFPKEELYDLTLATLIDRRGFLPLSKTDAAETLKHLVDAALDIQDAYLGRSTSFYEKGGRSTNKVAFLEKAVLDPGRLLTLLSGFPRASLSGRSFRSFLNDELTHFINNEDYSPKDRFTLLDILTTHGFLTDHSIQDFLPSNFTPEEWQRHLEAHPPSLSASKRATAGKSSLPMLDPLAVAALDPYKQRVITASQAAEEFLTTPPPTPPNTIDTTDLERTLNLSSQYQSQLQILRDSTILQSLPGGKEGITGIDNHSYPVPTLPEIRSALSSQPRLGEKIAQGFTRLLLVPFGMSLDDLRGKYKETLLAADQAGGLNDSQGNAVPLNRNDPLYTWEQYNNADVTGTLLYDPQEFSRNHHGKTKSDLLSSSSPSGFQVLLVEDIAELPREGQGATIGSRPQLECNRTLEDYLQTLQTDHIYRYETGLNPEAYIALAITRLRENGTVLNKGTYSFLTGVYFPSSGNVPYAGFDRGNRRAGLGAEGPVHRHGSFGARVGVRFM